MEQVLAELKQDGYFPRNLLDVGAHLGNFSRAFLALFPDCRPTLIEPNPYCAEALAASGFEWHACAASDKNASAALFLTREWLQSTGVSLYRENTDYFRDEVVIKHEVPTRRIDDIFAGRRFDFVKIDTQGAELDVLRGGENVLRQADYILVEISLTDYNQGGARAEAVFAQLRAMGFRCADVAEFHRLASVQNGALLQMDFLFRRRQAIQPPPGQHDVDALVLLSQALAETGARWDAIRVLESLARTKPGDATILQPLAKLLSDEGRIAEALAILNQWKSAAASMDEIVAPVNQLLPVALEQFNAHLAANELVQAETIVSGLIALAPQNRALLDAGLSCSMALGQAAKAQDYAVALIQVDPAHAMAQALLNPKTETHPLIRVRDLHDSIGEILCRDWNAGTASSINALLLQAGAINTNVPAGSEWEDWETHYRLMMDALDTTAVEAATPDFTSNDATTIVSSTGIPSNWPGLQRTATRSNVQAIFFAAADRAYIDQYARHYINSILAHCDVPCLILIHVIGGAAQLESIARSVGIQDKRVFFSGDDFDADAVKTACFDAPPKSRAAKPLAHLQSSRFLLMATLLRQLALPLFVSDIDLVLQQGIKDLLQRTESAAVVLNQNEHNRYAGSRFTANLLLARPGRDGLLFADFLASFLKSQLAKPRVSRWLDQIALMLARHHLMRHSPGVKIEYFDTSRDINNIMYRSYQDNPFRFLSLYHGFDMASLEMKKPKTRRKIPEAV